MQLTRDYDFGTELKFDDNRKFCVGDRVFIDYMFDNQKGSGDKLFSLAEAIIQDIDDDKRYNIILSLTPNGKLYYTDEKAIIF